MTTDTELRDLLAKAHDLPWRAHDVRSGAYTWVALYDDEDTIPESESLPSFEPGGSATPADAELIAAAVNALPGLLDRMAEAERERNEAQMERADALLERDEWQRVAGEQIQMERDRAEAAEAKLAAIEGLAEEWERLATGNEVARGRATKVAGYYRLHATQLRALLDTPAPTPTPGHGTCGQPGCSDGGV